MDKKGGFIHFKKSKKQPFPIIISTQNLLILCHLHWKIMAIEKSSSTIKIFNIFLYFTPLSLTSRGLLVHRLFSQTTRSHSSPISPLQRRYRFAVRSEIEDTRSADTYVMQFSPWTRRSTLLSWKLAARGSILAAYFTEQWRRWALKPGGLETREGERAVLAC